MTVVPELLIEVETGTSEVAVVVMAELDSTGATGVLETGALDAGTLVVAVVVADALGGRRRLRRGGGRANRGRDDAVACGRHRL